MANNDNYQHLLQKVDKTLSKSQQSIQDMI